MIVDLLFAISFFSLGLAFAAVLTSVNQKRMTITCRCGTTVARDILIVDSRDIKGVADALTETCPACRQARRSANPQPLHPRTLDPSNPQTLGPLNPSSSTPSPSTPVSGVSHVVG